MDKTRMRTLRPLLVGAFAAFALALPTAAAAQPNQDSAALASNARLSAALSMDVVPSASLKPCSSRYVHASLSWGHKCLAVGQFCKVGNREYRRYGFYCPASGHLRRR
jgi:hypothetical protein